MRGQRRIHEPVQLRRLSRIGADPRMRTGGERRLIDVGDENLGSRGGEAVGHHPADPAGAGRDGHPQPVQSHWQR